METIIDLDEIFQNNHIAIREGTYDWKDDEVRAVYKLAYHTLKKVNYPLEEEKDIIQELMLVFFSKVIKQFDIDKNIKISTYATTAFLRKCYSMSRKKRVETISINKKISNNVDDGNLELQDILADNSDMEKEIERKKEDILNRFEYLNRNNKIVLEYFFAKEKVTLDELAKKYGYSRAYISKVIINAVEKSKNDQIMKLMLY